MHGVVFRCKRQLYLKHVIRVQNISFLILFHPNAHVARKQQGVNEKSIYSVVAIGMIKSGSGNMYMHTKIYTQTPLTQLSQMLTRPIEHRAGFC